MEGEESLSELKRSQRVSGNRRSTRSQVAPDWTATDALILVNEVAAVEADCLKAFSSFQKWTIIAGNCTALGVSRSLNQYRRKWDALRDEYNSIKQWESQSGAESYWDLGIGRRKQLGLPENFDHELFKAIDSYVRVQENQSDTDPDPDPDPDSDPEAEAEADMPDFVAEPEPKRKRRRSTRQKSCPIENSVRSCAVEKPAEKPHETLAEEKPVVSCSEEEIPLKSLAEEKLQKSCAKKKHKNSPIKEEAISIEEQEQRMAMKLRENAELIRAIVTEKAENVAADGKSTKDLQTDFVRRQGDRVIACLGDIVKTLDQFHHLFRGGE